MSELRLKCLEDTMEGVRGRILEHHLRYPIDGDWEFEASGYVDYPYRVTVIWHETDA